MNKFKPTVLLWVSLLLSIAGHSFASDADTISYDYVIVGAGTSGSVLAAKLSDPDPITGKFKNSVLVLEAGENLTADPLVLDANNFFGSGPTIFNPKYSKEYIGVGFGGANVDYSEGRMWGGSSSHNGVQAYRGTPELYDRWAAITGDSVWSYANLLSNIFLKMEKYTPNGTTANPAQRGSAGPLFISQEPPLNTDAFMTAVSIGTNAPFVSDLNDPSLGVIGIGANQDWVTPPFLGPNSVRCSSANAFLVGISGTGDAAIVDAEGNGLNGRKLKIISGATVARVIFNKNNVAKKVEFVLSTDRETVMYAKAKEKIILSAGTIQDAVILQRSGIGDPAILTPLDIPVVFANPLVGAKVQNHYGPEGVIGGVTTTVGFPRIGAGFIDLSPFMSSGVRRTELLIANFVLIPPGIASALNITSGITLANLTVTPGSTGTVQIVSSDPFTDPIINFNFYSDGPYTTVGTDAYKAVAFYHILKTIATAAGGTVLFPPAADYTAGDAALFNDAVNSNAVGFHLCGSCPMGSSSLNGVVDSRLNVFGVSNLMVASNAIPPVIEDGNPAYSAFTIGIQAALFLGAQF